jgi:pimeloyl-ACP methyl ester carboxylesterase
VNFSHIVSAALLALMAASAAAKPVSQQGRSCHLPGAEEGLRCITLPLPLDYATKDGPTLALHVTVAPAFREAARPDPLFILAGGPGQAGSDVLVLIAQTFRRARATRDIVLIDQRGTGLSGKLDCDKKNINEETMSEAEIEAAARACIASVKQPFSAYGTASAARDIEQVRLALGYDKINLWGASYGTRLAQAYARAYPTAVRAMILDGVVAPDQVIPAGGRDGQAALDLVFRQCAENAACQAAFPDLRQEFASLSARVAAGAVKLELPDPRTARPVKLAVTSDRFLGTVHNILYNALDARRLPYLIHSAYQGRWEPFVARRNLAGDYSADGPVAQLMHLAVVCAEDLPRLTPALQAEDETPLTKPLARHIGTMCGMMNVKPAATPATTPIAQPVLLLSGELDPVTPPRRALAAARFMQRNQHLVVTYAGHGISQLGCAPRLLREFLDHPEQPVQADCLKEIPAPTFQLGNAGPQP